jgi:glycosyltransferase involved in cell wall biosynthesis
MENRILFIAHDGLADGGNQSLLNIVSSLKSRNIFVTVIFPEKGIICNMFNERGWNYYIVNFKTELCPKANNFFDYIKNILRSYYKDYYNREAIKKMQAIIDDNKINIVHSNSSVIGIGEKLAKSKNIKHVWHIREYIHPNYGLYVFGGLAKYKTKIHKARNIICITHGVAKGFGVEKKSVVLNDAVRKEPKYLKPVLKKKYFLFCGTLSKNKGVEEAILAFSQACEHSDYKLLIVGEGIPAYKEFLTKLVTEIGLEKKIEFLGFRNDVDDLMASATAFLMCSRNEALGRVTVEAMLNFCVVFGFNDSGTSEIIEHKKTGYLYDNIQELIEYMVFIINNPDNFNITRDNAYEYAKSNFLENEFTDRLINFYHNIN